MPTDFIFKSKRPKKPNANPFEMDRTPMSRAERSNRLLWIADQCAKLRVGASTADAGLLAYLLAMAEDEALEQGSDVG